MASCGGTRHGLRAEGGGLRGGVRSTAEEESAAAADADAVAGASAASAEKGDNAGACLAEVGGVDAVLPPPFLDVVWCTMVAASPWMLLLWEFCSVRERVERERGKGAK